MRLRCSCCLQPEFSCFCPWLKPFDPGVDFIILIHPIEIKRRRITTGRMAHMSLINSQLIMGQVYTHDIRVNTLLNDSQRHCVLLYPGLTSANLTEMPKVARAALCPSDKRLTIFVVDGTWATAKKTVNQSLNLKTLPRVCFTPSTPSTFRVRKQPRPECYSTIEAIHHTIELLCPNVTDSGAHNGLLHAFDRLVERQMELAASGRPRGRVRRPSQNETEL